MANTAIARFVVGVFIVAASFETALCLKCFSCSGASLVECEKNETVSECNKNLDRCGLIYLHLGVPANVDFYTKNCFSSRADVCNSFNFSLPYNCTYTPCLGDHCNGIAPTTLVPTRDGTTTGQPGTDPSNKPADASNDASTVICNKAFQLLAVGVVAALFYRP